MGGGDSEIARGDDARPPRVRVLRAARRPPRGAAARAAHRVEPPLRARRRLGRHRARRSRARRRSSRTLAGGAAVARDAHRRGASRSRGARVALRHDARSQRCSASTSPLGEARGDPRAPRLRAPRVAGRALDVWEVPSYPPGRLARGRPHRGGRARARLRRHPDRRCPPIRPSRDAGPREALARGARARRRSRWASARRITYAFVDAARRSRRSARRRRRSSLQNPLERRARGHAHEPPARAPRARSRTRAGTASATCASSRSGTLFLAGGAGRRSPTSGSRSPRSSPGERAGVARASRRPSTSGTRKGARRGARRAPRSGATADACAPARGRAPAHLHPRGAAWVEVERQARRARSARSTRTSLDAFELGRRAPSSSRSTSTALEAARRAPVALRPHPALPGEHARPRARRRATTCAAGDVERAVRDAAGDLAEEVSLFDRFVGGSVPAGPREPRASTSSTAPPTAR